MLKHLSLITFLLTASFAYSQDLMNERIRKIAGTKRNIYFKKGIFHSGENTVGSTLKAVRHAYRKKSGYERLVFDFGTNKPPKVYGYLSNGDKKIYVDFYKTALASNVGSFGNSNFVKKVDFYPVGDEMLSTEVVLKSNYSIDVFYLEKPGRVVIDIKK